ncbi:21198_t:CDS:1, partial [Racocetra persica]
QQPNIQNRQQNIEEEKVASNRVPEIAEIEFIDKEETAFEK